MSKILYVFILFPLMVFAESSPFDKKLIEFRYSLNQDLDVLNPLEIREMKFKPKTQARINGFLQENKKEIFTYQSNLLELNRTEKYILNPLAYSPVNTDQEKLQKPLQQLLKDTGIYSVYQLLLLNPFSACNIYVNMYLGRIYSAEEFGGLMVRQQITGGPRIYCSPLSAGEWEITLDGYTYIMNFKYNLIQDTLNLEHVYTRIQN